MVVGLWWEYLHDVSVGTVKAGWEGGHGCGQIFD